MKILLIIGNHPRHIYLENLLFDRGLLSDLIVQDRESFSSPINETIIKKNKKLYIEHFKKREESELKFYGNRSIKFDKYLSISPDDLNSDLVINYIKSSNPDILITNGIGIIKDNLLNVFPEQSWNIHGGLSPWFKGSITHFWPSYFLKPQYTGVTIHYISSKIDAGKIIHQTPAILKYNDSLHDLSSRSLKVGYESIPKLIDRYESDKFLPSVTQKNTGKLWLKKDWKPEHLQLIYEFYNDKVVNMYLDGKFEKDEPKIFDNFKF